MIFLCEDTYVSVEQQRCFRYELSLILFLDQCYYYPDCEGAHSQYEDNGCCGEDQPYFSGHDFIGDCFNW